MNHDRRLVLTLMFFVVGAGAGGCSALNGRSSEWWLASVTDVVSPLEIPSGVGRNCSATSHESSDPKARTVALVRYRIGRAPYSAAYAVAADGPIHAGDQVLVQPSSCRIKLADKAGA